MSLTRVQLSGESERERDECRPRRLFVESERRLVRM